MQERKQRWNRIEELTGLILQQPADINALIGALGYDKTRCRPGGEGSGGSSLRLYDLSTDFSLFTGEDFADDQPTCCTRLTEDLYNRFHSDFVNRIPLANQPNKPYSPLNGKQNYSPSFIIK